MLGILYHPSNFEVNNTQGTIENVGQWQAAFAQPKHRLRLREHSNIT